MAENSDKIKCHICHEEILKDTFKAHAKEFHAKIKHFCDICHIKVFRIPNLLRLHKEAVHQKLRRHKCDYCDYRGALPQHVKYHVGSAHQELKNHKCIYCDYRAKLKISLVRHIKVVHFNEKHLACNECDYRSAHSRDLRKHIEKHHT